MPRETPTSQETVQETEKQRVEKKLRKLAYEYFLEKAMPRRRDDIFVDYAADTYRDYSRYVKEYNLLTREETVKIIDEEEKRAREEAWKKVKEEKRAREEAWGTSEK